jgi:hypothetical protein
LALNDIEKENLAAAEAQDSFIIFIIATIKGHYMWITLYLPLVCCDHRFIHFQTLTTLSRSILLRCNFRGFVY